MNRQTFKLEVNPTLPPALGRLDELAANLRFSWHRPTRKLFETLDPELWQNVSGNPKLFLRCLDQARLDRAAADPAFLDEYHRQLRTFDAYRQESPQGAGSLHLEPGDLVAYFCAEYGFHESFPIYSGGLGILAGDHCKTASDVGLEFVAVGLLYRQGYFTQALDQAGNQVPQYRDFSSDDLPVQCAFDAEGRPLRVRVRLADRDVHAQVWRARAGRIDVVLLDTNVPENGPADREITHKLYGGDRETRIQQEMVLGIGGVKALRALGLQPTVWHMNEGHAAFLGIELLGELVDRGVSLPAALEAVAAASVFTTHTPVAAGHDAFAPELVLRYFADYARRLGLSAEGFLALGRGGPAGQPERAQHGGEFNMTNLALHLSRRQNGVSRIHGGVSAQICGHAWPEIPAVDNPIGYVTNGVHVPTFLFQRWKDLFDQHYGDEWRRKLSDPQWWQRVYELPDPLFWEIRQAVKSSMLRLVRDRLQRECQRNAISDAHYARLCRWIDPADPNVLTIGFARRFATYKRATLLFRDPRWLQQIVGDPDRPVVFVFAGKAHPADEPGRRLIREVHEMAQRPEFLGRVLFVEDYDMGLARSLVAGVDVWLNNPVYPLEASGTSGMKAGINGTINLSVLDGWWAEGYEGQNGWAIPSSTAEDAKRDDEDARSLYEILQDQVVPTYYTRDASGLPTRWIQKSKRSMATLLPAFNSRRMLQNYVTGMYRPASAHGRLLQADGLAAAGELAAWRARATAAWPGVKLRLASERPERVTFGDRVQMRVAVQLNGLQPGDARVELLLARELPDGPHEPPLLTSFQPDERVRVRDGRLAAIELFAPTGEVEQDGAHVFAIECTPPWCGQLSAEVRAVPYHRLLANPYELGLMRWL
jgi:starch phosphorylase